MAVYSIGDLEKLTGIKSHTLRIWEQRYQIIQPKRTPTNIRYYDDDDLRALLNIALLNKNGFKISKIAKMTEHEIREKVFSISDVKVSGEAPLDALTISMLELDEAKFDKIISTHIQQIGFEATMIQIIFPFLEKVGMLWMTNSVTAIHEYFVTYIIRNKTITAISDLSHKSSEDAPLFFIFQPEGEQQELSFLFLQFLLKSRNHQLIHLGQSLSLEEVGDVYKIRKPDYIFTMLNQSPASGSIQDYINKLTHLCPESHILLTGFQVVGNKVVLPPRVQTLNSLQETVAFVESLR